MDGFEVICYTKAAPYTAAKCKQNTTIIVFMHQTPRVFFTFRSATFKYHDHLIMRADISPPVASSPVTIAVKPELNISETSATGPTASCRLLPKTA